MLAHTHIHSRTHTHTHTLTHDKNIVSNRNFHTKFWMYDSAKLQVLEVRALIECVVEQPLTVCGAVVLAC